MSAVENFGQKRHWRRWTARELARAESLFNSGGTVAEISAALGRTEAAIMNLRFKLKHPHAAPPKRGEAIAAPAQRIDRRADVSARQRWDEAGLAELQEMLAKGMMQCAIAVRLNRTDDSIAYGAAILRRRGEIAGAARAEQRSERACLRCRETFLSAGIHNRLCFTCGKWAEDHQNQYGMPSVTLTGDARANLRSRDGAMRKGAGI